MYFHLSELRARRIAQRTQGGVLIVALLLTAAAAFGFTAWANLIAQRRQSIEETVGGMTRRLSVENGRQSALQLGYNQLLTKNGGAAMAAKEEDATTQQIYGGLTTPAWAGYSMDSIRAGKVNHFSPAGISFAYEPDYTFTVPYSVMDYYPSPIWRANGTTSVVVAARSRVPMLSGDILNIYKPTLALDTPLTDQTITGNLDVVGARAALLTPAALDNFAGLRASGIFTPVYSVPNTNPMVFRDPVSNDFVMPSNFPSTLTTTGSVGTGNVLDTQHRLNVIDSPDNPSNSLRNKVLNGLVYVTLDTTQDRAPSQGIGFVASTGVLTLDLAESTFWGLIADNNISEIILNGQSSNIDTQASVRICYVEHADTTAHTLSKVTYNGSTNLRPIVMGIKKVPPTAGLQVPGAPVTMSFADSGVAPLWRMMLVMENTPLAFEAAGGAGALTLMGGIMTDGSIAATSGAGNSVILVPETDHTHLIQLVPRRAWMETYLDFTNGSL
jgi:hypothetical protein